ncbi:hypothetical protein QWZ16_17145 [Vibrio ostreicida]|uniref:Transposase n=1 Tax=Vibrio ostreicida TaxID=526588 RepID=A0ABT8BY73_9VIBR|nr:hypothetical protein [Vibrio ostreicida]MDN3611329.1 hypothetical protein [Vibrio ostreicida]
MNSLQPRPAWSKKKVRPSLLQQMSWWCQQQPQRRANVNRSRSPSP